MIEIVVPPISEGGGRWECSNCHCIFNYDKEDIQEIKAEEYYSSSCRYSLDNYNVIFIKCPVCNNDRILNVRYKKC